MFPMLFEPVRIGTMEIPNRILMPSIGTMFSMDQRLNERHYRFYERRAQGGAGVIVAGPAGVDFLGTGIVALSISEDSFIPEYKQLADRVHVQGSKLMIQLFHGGRYVFSFSINGQQALAPSAVPSRYTRETPKEMTLEDIEQVQDAFAQAARRARDAGVDGVEIIGSAGYLISEFLSPVTNLRTDQYGGTFENRARFAVETIQRIRSVVGPDYPVTIRVPGNDFVPGGNTNDEIAKYCVLFEEAGIDGFNVTGGWHETFVSQLTMEVPRGGYAYLAGGIRSAVNKPVISSNRITDPFTAEKILKSGQADMVALGRVLIADPDWPIKAREGRPAEIRPCVGCMQGCMDKIFTGQPLCCLVNPEAGLEEDREIKPAQTPKKVMIVGAGPGGLEAARVAATAGHKVDLYEKDAIIGGQLNVAGRPAGRGEFLEFIEYYKAILSKLDINIHTGTSIDIEKIRQLAPEALIIAEGAEPIVPNIPGVDLPFVISSWDFLKNNPPIGKKVAIIGGGAVGLETAMEIAKIGTIHPQVLEFLMFNKAESDEKLHELIRKGTKEVTVIEMLPKVGQDVGKSSRWVWMNDLKERNVRLLTNAKVEEIAPDGTVAYAHEGVLEKEHFDTVILSVGSKPQKSLSEDLEAAGISFTAIGDCKGPRKIIDAVHEGYLASVDI